MPRVHPVMRAVWPSSENNLLAIIVLVLRGVGKAWFGPVNTRGTNPRGGRDRQLALIAM